ncbi:Aldo/keto reductase [Laetiporus sulphureus 93-53]|uniref:Aldo/keto reductase n=1 Tax=Laetiporus sulphureus 93-53 TaxID=1314785 RepID=A0A165ERC7_9APHY|nr:Aldo/keto reductase [Laetiporus sulphureus 93-53]KZT07605.1 Aldo/keto reductase [Laetiporus sulphureus 93-53]
MSLDLQSKLKLRDGNEIPIMGFGTYEMDGKEAYSAVKYALETGYRHVDSAEWYHNEHECGRAILDFCASSGVPRSEIWYTTKLRSNSGYAASKAAIAQSLETSSLGYIDLYLVHSPIGGPQKRAESWKAVLEAKKEGLVRSVGVSNYGVRHLQEMLQARVELPVINQVDLHPFMTRADIVALCQEHGMALEAWAPLVRGLRFKHPSIVSLAKKYHKDPAQVLLRYSLQKGYIPLPKSSKPQRIKSNVNVYDFELTADEIAHLDSLDEELVTDWDPTKCP